MYYSIRYIIKLSQAAHATLAALNVQVQPLVDIVEQLPALLAVTLDPGAVLLLGPLRVIEV